MNKVSSVLGAAAVIAIAVVFIVQFRPATGAQAASGPVCAVEIRGSCVSSTHFWAAYRVLAPRNADAARLRSMGLRRQVIEGLVDRHLLVEDAKRLGVTIGTFDNETIQVTAGLDDARSLIVAGSAYLTDQSPIIIVK